MILISGTSKSNLIHLIDFGLAKEYMDLEGNHIPMKRKQNIVGTARYMSINTHNLIESSRRDDLEAIGYMLMYFLRGALPWQGIKGKNHQEKYMKIGQFKENTSMQLLCAGFPTEFAIYLTYVRKLEFTQEPNYDYLIELFARLFRRENFRGDNIYDWNGIELTKSTASTIDRETSSNWELRDPRSQNIERSKSK